MGCGEVIIPTISIDSLLRRHVVGIKTLPLPAVYSKLTAYVSRSFK